jgi:phage terminase large subunit
MNSDTSIVNKARTLLNSITLDFQSDVNDSFQSLFYNEDRYLVLKGGAGSGKSHAVAQKIIYRCLTDKVRHRFLILRKTNNSVRKSAYQLVKDKLSTWNLPYETKDLYIEFNGCQLIFSGLDDPEKIKSIEGITGIWMEEATEFTERDLNQLNLRLRGNINTYKQIILSFNPVGGRNTWLYKRFFEKETSNTFIHHSTWRDNKYIDEEYKNAIKATTDETYLKIYDLGQWAELKNAIYNNYVIRNFDREEIETKADRRYCGLDFGFNDPSVCLYILEYDQDIYISNELYVTQKTNAEFIQLIRQMLPNANNLTYYADSAEPDRIKEFNMSGLSAIKAQKSIKDGIDEVKRRKIIIHGDCENCIKEIPMYSYKENANGEVLEEPIDYKNHTCDSLRYGVYTAKQNQEMQLFV